MAATLFDLAAEHLERSTEMDRLTARGTLRLAMKEAGLDIQQLSLRQLRAVFSKLMPGALELRGISDAAATCDVIIGRIERAASSADLDEARNPDEIFERLGGS